MESVQICGICGIAHDSLFWINDSYGIPFKKVCSDKCAEEANSQLSDYVNDDEPDCMLGWD